MYTDLQLIVNFIIFVIAFFKVIKNTDENGNILMVLLYLEVMLLSSTLTFIVSSSYLDDITGHVFALVILVVAAGESAIALALVIAYYKLTGSVSFKGLNALRG